ncbi:calmodulin binding protein PICBP-like isoform X2 [Abrus precatorius]|uniref:Calmodulin binding protein PICBP-like isoform X2 n=1 Tax=Abrus precatorius TaxID=3816 RepID=A0A8B8KAU5_ABRPR|nr:calmodulin binding protein PICBP-like isoform X2 [Abrus precatorius]
MVQRKVPSKLGIEAEHKMKKSRPIKLSDLESLQSSSPSRRSLSQPGKPPPLHVPSASPQKQQPLFRTTDGSPNYMKPTSSSHAKKELFPVSHRNTQSGSDFKNPARKFSSDSKAACVKKLAKTLTRSTSLSLVRTLTKTTSFKASRACPRKSTRASLCTPQRATCSSTLKDSKFPAYLMLNPEGTESEGTSVMKVCPYTYCSLNGHHHADSPPLKSFMSSRRRLLKMQKRTKLQATSPRSLMVPLETEKEDSDVEQNVFDAKAPSDEIGCDVFIEIYANERVSKPTAAEGMGKVDFLKEIEDQEDLKSTIEDNDIATNEEGVTRDITLSFETEIDLEDDIKKSFDDVETKGDTKGSFSLQEQNTEEADEDHQPILLSHEEISMGSYCSDDEQHMGDVDMDDSDSKSYDMEWEKERVCKFEHEEDADSSVYTAEDNDSSVEFSSESSHDMSVTWLDDILINYYEHFLVDETNSEESTYFEEQPDGIVSVPEDPVGITETEELGYSSTGIMGCDQSSVTDEIQMDDETIDSSQCQKMCEICKIDEANEDGYLSSIENENKDESNKEENQIHFLDVSEESNMADHEQEMLKEDQSKAKRLQSTSCIGGEEQNTSRKCKVAIRRKRNVEDDDEMRKFNPKEPNFLPLVPEPEPEKVDLRHQMMDERKNGEQWMLDCALREVVTKLAPARKKKVALLVEAFETVMPVPKCETQVRNDDSFAHAGRIQACS